MTDADTSPQPMPAVPGTDPEFNILKIYVKDMSFESPHSPAVFRMEWTPDLDLQMHTQAEQSGEGEYEVTLVITVTVKVAEQTAFLAEVQQSGLFAIAGVADDDLGALLGSLCPGILYPYAREAVSDLATRGGFPQLVLAPVNFDALYAQHLASESGHVAHEMPGVPQ